MLWSLEYTICSYTKRTNTNSITQKKKEKKQAIEYSNIKSKEDSTVFFL